MIFRTFNLKVHKSHDLNGVESWSAAIWIPVYIGLERRKVLEGFRFSFKLLKFFSEAIFKLLLPSNGERLLLYIVRVLLLGSKKLGPKPVN